MTGESGPLYLNSQAIGFTEFLRDSGYAPGWDVPVSGQLETPEATTVLGLRYADGVLVVGDRQATEGYSVAHRKIKKVYPADRFSAVAISGTAGLAVEMVKLFQTELEHYEKIEGSSLSLEGKANYLARMVRQQLPLAFQGLAVVPLFCGYDDRADVGRMFTFDVVGGQYEEEEFGATGSGSKEAKAYLRSHFGDELGADEALELALRALVAAAEEDVATGGPDPRRGIYPTVVTVTSDGYDEVGEEQVSRASETALRLVR